LEAKVIKIKVNFFKNLKGSSGYVKWLAGYTKPFIPTLLLLMMISAISSGITVGTAVIGKRIIDNATNSQEFTGYIILYIIVIVGVQIISIITSLVSIMMNEKFSFGIRKQVYEKILNSNYHHVQKYHTGDLMTRFTSDCGTVANGIASIFPSIITLIIEFIITFSVLFHYEPLLAISAILIAPIGAFISFWLARKLRKLQTKVQESEANYRSFIQESLSNILIIKTFCYEQYSVERLTELRDERFYWVLKKNRLSLASSSIISFAFQAGYLLAFSWGVIKLSAKAITYGTMSVFLTLVNRIQAPIMNLASTIPTIVSVLTSAGRIMEIQELPVENRLDNQINNKEDIGVNIKELSFGYADELLLQQANLNIRPHEFVAIVGESGIGKTTLIRLIMSFITANSGNIEFYNSTGESQISNGNSREFLSYVPQGNTLFSGTIKNNLLMGCRTATDDELIQALKAAGAYDFVQELPSAINAVIGERGFGISEGQAQRIAIARALLKKAPFLILDEATSSLDEATELEVLQGIRNITPRPTCLLITHRHSVLAYCDREIRIDNNQLFEIQL
jgi:ABC-type multidrug transport system fused ATPase/permease subunit